MRESRLTRRLAALVAPLRALWRRLAGTPVAHEAGRSATGPAPARAPTPTWESTLPAAVTPGGPGEFVAGSFDSPFGTRDYKFYRPPAADELAETRRLPLVVMLHGCGQNPDDFALGTGMNDAARTHGLFVLYPAQSRANHAQRCWNWYRPAHQHRGRGEPALIAALVRELRARHPIDPARVYVAGLSAGGSMAAILGETYPDLFAAVGVHSGMAAGVANDLPSALMAMKAGGSTRVVSGSGMPTMVFHGDADRAVNIVNAEQVIALSVGVGVEGRPRPTPPGGARAVSRQVYADRRGHEMAEIWCVHGAPHAWSGGRAPGSFTDPDGPDATTQFLRFFAQHRLHAPA